MGAAAVLVLYNGFGQTILIAILSMTHLSTLPWEPDALGVPLNGFAVKETARPPGNDLT